MQIIYYVRPPPAGARLLALRLRERGRGGHRSVGPDGLLWTRSVKRRPVVCGSVKRTCAARATTRNQPCVPVASVVSRMLSTRVAEPFPVVCRDDLPFDTRINSDMREDSERQAVVAESD